MSIVNKINVSGTEYDIRDSQAGLDIKNGSGVFGMAMAHDGRANNENEYQAVRYQIYERRRTDQDFAALSGRAGAIVMDGKAVIDGTVTSTVQTQTGNFSNSVRLNFTAANLGVAAPAQSSSTVLSTVICGALPSYRYTTSNGNIISSDTVIGSGETPAETYNQKVFSGFTTSQFFFLVPTQFRVGGTDASPVYLAQGETLADKKADVAAYLADHPITVYYQTAAIADAQEVYVAVPALEAADVQEALNEKTLPNVWGLFRNAVCIGDSLTRGYYSAYASGERNRDYGYPSALSRLTGMNVWNFGLSGSNPDEWLANATLAQEDYSRFDAAFVAFGQNRASQTDAEYQEMYLSVLARLKTANPNMVIFCLSNPGPNQNTNIQAIVAAATASSGSYQYSYVYFLDISGGDYAAHRTDGTHLDAVGYAMLAEAVKIAAEKVYINAPGAIYLPRTMDNVIAHPVNPMGKTEEQVTALTTYARATYLSEPDDRIWEQGSITAGTGANSSPSSSVNHARIRTLSTVDYVGAVIDENYEAIIYAYDTNDVYIGSWNGHKFTTNTAEVEWFSNCSIWFNDINPAYNYKLVVRKVSEEDILPSENSHVKFITKTAGQRLDDLEGAVKSLGDLEKNRGLTPTQLQAICASGHAPDYFDIGDIIYIDWTDYTDAQNPVTYHVPHVVVHFGDVEDPEGNVHRNGMYLMWMYGTPASASMVFDAAEEIVADEATFQSGYYYYTKNGNESFAEQEVTAGAAIPAGKTYYKHYRTGMARRLQNGSDDYSQSAYRQWLNSDADAGEWWTAQHPSDVAPLMAATKPGFLKGYSNEWLAIFKPSKVQTVKNLAVDDGQVAVTYDRFFLPSDEQVYGSNSRKGVEGTYWEYWKEVTGLGAPSHGSSVMPNEARVITRMGTSSPTHMRLRTTKADTEYYTYGILNGGYISPMTAKNGYACQPSTIIY